jgi:hypothetical protein
MSNMSKLTIFFVSKCCSKGFNDKINMIKYLRANNLEYTIDDFSCRTKAGRALLSIYNLPKGTYIIVNNIPKVSSEWQSLIEPIKDFKDKIVKK